jgi:hypothetical protein
MAVRKLRRLPDHDESIDLGPDDARLPGTWSLAARLCPPSFPPGVYKHASVESQNRLTEEWERATVARQSARVR